MNKQRNDLKHPGTTLPNIAPLFGETQEQILEHLQQIEALLGFEKEEIVEFTDYKVPEDEDPVMSTYGHQEQEIVMCVRESRGKTEYYESGTTPRWVVAKL